MKHSIDCGKMGITDANALCQLLLQRSVVDVTHGKFLGPTILYIDGPILIFSGNVKGTLTLDININTHMVVRNSLKKFDYVVNYCQKISELTRVVVVFDGISPIMKSATQLKRRGHLYPNINVKDIGNALRKALDMKTNVKIDIVNLERGEAESYIYKNRDQTQSSVLFTKDTDLYAIAYKHCPVNPVDHVFFYNDSKRELYDMSKFSCDLDPMSFRLLMALSGTDFNPKIFTKSMLLALSYYLFCDIPTFEKMFGAPSYTLMYQNWNICLPANISLDDLQRLMYRNWNICLSDHPSLDDIQRVICTYLTILTVLRHVNFLDLLYRALDKKLLPVCEKMPKRITYPHRRENQSVPNIKDSLPLSLATLRWVLQYYESGAELPDYDNDELGKHKINNVEFLECVKVVTTSVSE